MAGETSRKRNFIEISASDESEPESSPPVSDGDFVGEISSSSTSSDDEDDDNDASGWNYAEDDDAEDEDEDEDEDCADAHVDKDDVDSMCNKVTQLVRGGSDLQELKLVEFKAYLRRNGLRLSGTKVECIERIKEHWRLKHGNGEAFYPRSSFTINCTGDVCMGDVVLFKQKVHQNHDKNTRSRSLRRRTVAGRVIKESYGAAKQQHTFTVEVLWSRGTKKLDPLFPLLVKGRNLYKMKTYRQRWKNERERLEVLSEKHKRGAAARNIRAMRQTKGVSKTDKSSTYKGAKRHKNSHYSGPSRTRETTNSKRNCLNKHEKAAKHKIHSPSQSSATFENFSSKRDGGRRIPSAPHWRHQNFIQSVQLREPPYLQYNYPSQNYNQFRPDFYPSEPYQFPPRRGSSFTPRLPYSNPLPRSGPNPVSEWKEFSHSSFIDPRYSHSEEFYKPRNFNGSLRQMNNDRSFYHSANDTRRWR